MDFFNNFLRSNRLKQLEYDIFSRNIIEKNEQDLEKSAFFEKIVFNRQK